MILPWNLPHKNCNHHFNYVLKLFQTNYLAKLSNDMLTIDKSRVLGIAELNCYFIQFPSWVFKIIFRNHYLSSQGSDLPLSMVVNLYMAMQSA